MEGGAVGSAVVYGFDDMLNKNIRWLERRLTIDQVPNFIDRNTYKAMVDIWSRGENTK